MIKQMSAGVSNSIRTSFCWSTSPMYIYSESDSAKGSLFDTGIHQTCIRKFPILSLLPSLLDHSMASRRYGTNLLGLSVAGKCPRLSIATALAPLIFLAVASAMSGVVDQSNLPVKKWIGHLETSILCTLSRASKPPK